MIEAEVYVMTEVPVAAKPIYNRQELLRLSEVMALTKLAESTIYERMAAGAFPIPVQLTARAVAWPAAEVLDWMASLPRTVIRQARVTKPGGAAQ